MLTAAEVTEAEVIAAAIRAAIVGRVMVLVLVIPAPATVSHLMAQCTARIRAWPWQEGVTDAITPLLQVFIMVWVLPIVRFSTIARLQVLITTAPIVVIISIFSAVDSRVLATGPSTLPRIIDTATTAIRILSIMTRGIVIGTALLPIRVRIAQLRP